MSPPRPWIPAAWPQQASTATLNLETGDGSDGLGGHWSYNTTYSRGGASKAFDVGVPAVNLYVVASKASIPPATVRENTLTYHLQRAVTAYGNLLAAGFGTAQGSLPGSALAWVRHGYLYELAGRGVPDADFLHVANSLLTDS